VGKFSVIFFPDNVATQVEEGTSLFKAASQAGIELKSTCGNRGTCGRCAVLVKEGKVHASGGNVPARLRRAGYVLACQTFVEGNVVVEVPRDSRLDEHQVLVASFELREEEADLLAGYELEPVSRKFHIELPPPSVSDNTGDLERLATALRRQGYAGEPQVGLSTLRSLAETLRSGAWRATVTLAATNGAMELLALAPGKVPLRNFGLAVDIGTTTVVAHLVDLNTGVTVDKRGTYNRQARYGDDVISRIVYATEEKGGLDELHKAVIDTINELTEELLGRNQIAPEEVTAVVTAGNTTMAHLFLGLTPKYIRLKPYIPTANAFPPVRAGDLGLAVNPGAWVLSFPAVASYVGGDIVAGVLATRMAKEEPLTLFIDIGTNGEMVLGNRDWLISCACSAGPAFEGGGITFGMRAMKGAIERVAIDPQTFEVEVKAIGGYRPIGICGSGLIDLIAKLRRVGLIDRTGHFQRDKGTPRLRETEDGDVEFVLVWGAQSESGKDIVITESDIKTLIRSKGAVFAGVQSLLRTVGLELAAIDRILIAGGFGNYLNVADAVEIGLLPDLPATKYRFVGNTAVKGAKMGLLSRRALEEAREIAARMAYVELSVGTTFMDEFVSALFLPHTDLSLFPSVKH